MSVIKEFCGLRPPKNLAEKISELPYDVCSSAEARKTAEGNPYNFYHVTKPEIDLPENVDIYDESVYNKGAENFKAFIEKGYLTSEKTPCFYFYTLVMNGREQTGLVCTVSVDDYLNGVVKKHEFTREDKERDRIKHIDVLGAQTGLVFLFYKEDGSKKDLWTKALSKPAEYDFTAPDGIRHIFRIIDEPALIEQIKQSFKDTGMYIADGHHRAASAAKNALARRQDGSDTKKGDFNYFLSVVFPHDQLKIMPYNRVLADLNGNTKESLIAKISEKFTVSKVDYDTPKDKGSFCMYIDGEWYNVKPSFDTGNDPVESLDVSVLQNYILKPVFSIDDPRTSKKIDFIGGIRGTKELVKLVDSGKFKAAFSMYPTSMQDLMDVSDSGNVMPPKSTWFEPKLRDGLIVYQI